VHQLVRPEPADGDGGRSAITTPRPATRAVQTAEEIVAFLPGSRCTIVGSRLARYGHRQR